MWRYLLVVLLLAGCQSNEGTIVATDILRDGSGIIIVTSKGGTFIAESKAIMLFTGQEVEFSEGYLKVGTSTYKARRDY